MLLFAAITIILGSVVAVLLGILLSSRKRYELRNVSKERAALKRERENQQKEYEQTTAERLQAMLNASPLACFIIRENLEIMDLNNEMVRLFEAESKQDLIDNFFSLLPERQPCGEQSIEKIKMILASLDEPIKIEWLAQTKLGVQFPADVYVVRFSLDGAKAAIVHLSDLRERKEAERVIEETLDREQAASSAKSRFLSNMSHEIRTPMNAIIGMTDIARNTDDMAKKDDSIAKIAKASSHLLGLVNQILDMSRIEAGRFELNSHLFNFKKLVDEVVSVFSVSFEEKHLTFEIYFGEGIPDEVISDKTRFAQVLTNLISNAIKFTPEGGKISLAVSIVDDESRLHVEVADSGIGIPKHLQPRLFDDFMQVETDLSRKYTGTGLGLAITKQIIEMMGGEIWVESELGEGAKFIFTVPIQVKSPARRIPHTSVLDSFPQEIETNCFKGRTILIAEDVDINCEIVISLLEPTGVGIDCALDGARAVQMFRKNPDRYDLILMDVQMPEIDGLTATRLIREIGTEKAMSIPIVALTANVFQEDVAACIEAGMNDHISKPIDLNQMIEKLKMYL